MSAFPIPVSKNGEPAWEIATLYSDQGDLGDDEYLELTRCTRRFVEFTDGRVEVLPVPTTQHQLILQFLYEAMKSFITSQKLGVLVFAVLRVQIRDRKFREPDIVFMKREHLDRAQNDYWLGADLVVEIVSPDNPDRDLIDKRADYAEANIPEYWIVDPRMNRITVLKLVNGQYVTHSEAGDGGAVASALLEGLSVAVSPVFEAGKIAG